MKFYELEKEERKNFTEKIKSDILSDLENGGNKKIFFYFSDDDTYVRKAGYLALGKIYFEKKRLQDKIIEQIYFLMDSDDEKVRQTAINAAGEIGKKDFQSIESFMEKGLFDKHHSVRNAVIGSIKKMGEKNPKPVLKFAKKFLHHEDKEIRREICHGIELRGRTHPQEILPLLKELQNDKTSRVRNTLIQVIGQISYKKGCLPVVVEHLKSWENKDLISEALKEIIEVHDNYKDFAALTQKQAKDYIKNNFRNY